MAPHLNRASDVKAGFAWLSTFHVHSVKGLVTSGNVTKTFAKSHLVFALVCCSCRREPGKCTGPRPEPQNMALYNHSVLAGSVMCHICYQKSGGPVIRKPRVCYQLCA